MIAQTLDAHRAVRGMLRTAMAAIIASIACCSSAHALPRFSLLYGDRCSVCHYNPHGSSIRNELGFSTMSEVSAVTPDSIGLGWLYGERTHSLWDGLVEFGFDGRLQVAKLGRPPNDVRRLIPMQVAPSIAINPTSFLSIYGTYNAGPLRYGGQTSFDAAVQLQPDILWPTLRAGYIQPSIGVRYDDHTMFVRRDIAGSGAPIIAPNYNEVGAELTYEGIHWLTVNAGAFSAKNLAAAEPTVDANKPSVLGRVVLWPRLLEEGINGQIGASAYVNDKFRMINAFVGIGLSDAATLQGELMTSTNADDHKVRNLSVMGTYQPSPWISFSGRYEIGAAETPGRPTAHADAFVLGAEFFPIPYVELRPEYRYVRTEDYIIGQYSLQLHAFY